ncbi:hypothetical protein K5F24_16485 [Acinetobacter baumannii]|nr:hypothetical protein [Acinetobacter baumannii]
MTAEKLAHKAIWEFVHAGDKEFKGSPISFVAEYCKDVPSAQLFNLTRESRDKVKQALEKEFKESNWLEGYDIELTQSYASKLISTVKISKQSETQA